MDLEDEGWVSVPCDGLLEVHDDGDEKIFSRKYVKTPTKVYKQNHFNSSHASQDHVEDEAQNYVEDKPVFKNQFDHKQEDKEVIKHPILITEPKETSPELESEPESNPDPIFQVFSKKANVEMKIDSSRPDSQESDLSRTETDVFQYEEKNSDHVVNFSSSSKMMIEKEVVAWKESNQRLNFWKLGLNGIGVFCSLGLAATTICIIICGNGKRHKQQNQKIKFQIFQENKRIKEVVQKANEAISSVRGVPLINAKITYGGHCESL